MRPGCVPVASQTAPAPHLDPLRLREFTNESIDHRLKSAVNGRFRLHVVGDSSVLLRPLAISLIVNAPAKLKFLVSVPTGGVGRVEGATSFRGGGWRVRALAVRALLATSLATIGAAGIVEPVTSTPAGAAGVLLTISVSPTTASIAAGDTQQFTATGHYVGGTTENLTDSVTWSSTLTSVATVSSTGSRHRSGHRGHHHRRHLGAHLGNGGIGRHPGRAGGHHRVPDHGVHRRR